MSTILAIESSTDIASVALSIRSPVARVLSRQVTGVQSHSDTVLPMVQAVLLEAGIALHECDAIAFGAGPGSFTGVRTACGIVQGLAYGSQLPVVAVDTLIATAQVCRDATGCEDVLVAIDARMGQVYWGQYRWKAATDTGHASTTHTGVWETVRGPCLDAPAGVTATGNPQACGNGFAAYASIFSDHPAMRPVAQAALADMMPHAIQIAKLALPQFLRGQTVPARDAQPVYLRNNIALTTLERAMQRAAADR